jgi:alpha-L-rhamnosidase
MTQHAPLPEELRSASRLWLGPIEPGFQVRLLRRSFLLPQAPQKATLWLYAQFRFHLWFNGQYITRGPVFHSPNRMPLATLDLTPHAKLDENTLAVLVATPNMGLHNGVPTGEPGLIARFLAHFADAPPIIIPTDHHWRATAQTGWRRDTPKMGWALPPVEVFDAASSPQGWHQTGFDDSAWQTPDLRPPPASGPWITALPPGLVHEWHTPATLVDLSATHGTAHEIRPSDTTATYANALDDQPHDHDQTRHLSFTLSPDGSGPMLLSGLTPQRAAIVTLDLGAEHVGSIGITVDCPTAGVIDLAWTERPLDGRLRIQLKNTSYASRIIARPGVQEFETIGISGLRYLIVTFRGFSCENAPLRITRLGVRSSRPDLPWQARFSCDDQRLNQIWDMCLRSIQVGTQETVMDCPSREQAPYIGDGNPVAQWIGLLTGDHRHWSYLVNQSFTRQSPEGFLRSAIFTGNVVTLIDYNLIAILGVRDYLLATDDAHSAQNALEPCRAILRYFIDHASDPRFPGFYSVDAANFDKTYRWEHRYAPDTDQGPWSPILFIDHPGTGWHNIEEPGIDRTGVNIAINALLAVALRAMAQLEEAVGEKHLAHHWRNVANTITRTGSRLLLSGPGLFPDGLDNGLPKNKFSQQTNTWAAWAGFVQGEQAATLLKNVYASKDHSLARSGPYFWLYTLPLMAQHGQHAAALQYIRSLWGKMLDGGASTLWETFAGDKLDSWCHPWSAAPVPFLLEHILGFDLPGLRTRQWTLRPQTALLKQASGSVCSPHGLVQIQWNTEHGVTRLSGSLPADCQATVISPIDASAHPVTGEWQLTWPRAAT